MAELKYILNVIRTVFSADYGRRLEMQFRRKPNKIQAIQLTEDLWAPGETKKPIAIKGCWLITDEVRGQYFMTDELFKQEYELDLPNCSPKTNFPAGFGEGYVGIRAINTYPVIDPNQITCGGPRDL